MLQGTDEYDFAGRQAIRTIASTGVTIHSVFDSQGRRIAEYNQATGALIREYVWMEWEPIAVIEGGVTSFVRTDHIGRPVFATNTAGSQVWTASPARAGVRGRSSGKQSTRLFSDPPHPFGGVRTTTGSPINALRGVKQSPGLFAVAPHPGQWFQSESGLHQNWMRDYDPTTGRYLQADPLGLVDGASVYGYAMQSPMMYTDPWGEQSVVGPMLATSRQSFAQTVPSESTPLFCAAVTPDQCHEAYDLAARVCSKMGNGTSTEARRSRQRCYEQAANQLAECLRNARRGQSWPMVPPPIFPFFPGPPVDDFDGMPDYILTRF